MALLNFAFVLAFGGILAVAQERGQCVNTRDKWGHFNTCSAVKQGKWLSAAMATCTNYLKWKDCDNHCNLCACSTASGTTKQHCSGHGKCEADCTKDTCLNARCECDPGWYGLKCESELVDGCEDVMPAEFCMLVKQEGECELFPPAANDCKKTCGLCVSTVLDTAAPEFVPEVPAITGPREKWNDFSSVEAMEQGGWTFSWKDSNMFWPDDKYCGDHWYFKYTVPSTSYCGFEQPGDGAISYTFTFDGIADLRYGCSWNFGSVHVKKNEEEIDSINMGESEVTFDFVAGDVLTIYEVDESVINIHSLTLTERVDCVWSPFDEWTTCSAPCGTGTRSRTRSISIPAQGGGAECTGPMTETEECNQQICPTAKRAPGGKKRCTPQDPKYNQRKCPNWPYVKLERYSCTPDHGDVCRHQKWPKNMNWRCPRGCKKMKKAPFCRKGWKVCRV